MTDTNVGGDEWLKTEDIVGNGGGFNGTQTSASPDLDAEMAVTKGRDAQTGHKRKMLLLGVGIVVVIAAVVGIAVGVGGKNSNPNRGDSGNPSAPNAAPTPASAPSTPGPTPTNANKVEDAIRDVARQGGSEFQDPNSYQSRALEWVMTQDVPAPGVSGSLDEQATQLYALACIYFATFSVRNDWTDYHFGQGVGIPGWFSQSGWLGSSSQVCTSWYGITCNGDNKVEKIDLNTNGLTGSLPEETALLAPSLKYMDLYNNILHNKGPAGNDWLGELVNLEFLFFGTTSFEYDGIPTAIGKLTKLKELDMSYSLYFGAIPSGMWSGLTDLDYLVMDGNSYNSSFPADLVALPNLEYLYAGFSFVEGGLAFLTDMPKIFEIWVDDNPGLLGPIPENINEAATLASLSFSNCGISGTIPTSIGLMTDLQQLWMFDNKLNGAIPTELASMRKLAVLQLQGNKLTGEMPSGVCFNRNPIGRLEDLGADCDGEVTCALGDCCTCCGDSCVASRRRLSRVQ